MSSHPGFMTDWDLVHRWNWFRRDMWRQEFRTAVGGKGGGPTRAFAELAQMVGAQVLLDASCGLGKRAIHLAKEGAGIIGSDISENAILNAREFARSENAPVTFFRSPWNELPKNMPHHFDGALATGLSLEPSWDRLVAALAGLFQALHPGGFLMFAGAAETESPDGTRERLEKDWNSQPPERVEWFFRSGKTTCVLVKLRSKASDYIDERRLYVSEENGEARLESTVIRRPAYWTWNHWKNAVRLAGFQHLETRQYPDFSLNGGVFLVNVAWKGDGSEAKTTDAEEKTEEFLD